MVAGEWEVVLRLKPFRCGCCVCGVRETRGNVDHVRETLAGVLKFIFNFTAGPLTSEPFVLTMATLT